MAGDGRRAAAIMARLGYSADEVSIVRDEIHNFQGVGSPVMAADGC